jgi:hypothetical protein
MDAASVSANQLARVQDQAALLTFRKALDLQAATALQLLQALPAPAPAPDPAATLGRSIDTYA